MGNSALSISNFSISQVGLIYTVDSIMIAAGITLGLVIFLTIFAFQVRSFINIIINKYQFYRPR